MRWNPITLPPSACPYTPPSVVAPWQPSFHAQISGTYPWNGCLETNGATESSATRSPFFRAMIVSWGLSTNVNIFFIFWYIKCCQLFRSSSVKSEAQISRTSLILAFSKNVPLPEFYRLTNGRSLIYPAGWGIPSNHKLPQDKASSVSHSESRTSERPWTPSQY